MGARTFLDSSDDPVIESVVSNDNRTKGEQFFRVTLLGDERLGEWRGRVHIFAVKFLLNSHGFTFFSKDLHLDPL